jgi:hypothetical protein
VRRVVLFCTLLLLLLPTLFALTVFIAFLLFCVSAGKLGCAVHTAWTTLLRSSRLRPSDLVLLHL